MVIAASTSVVGLVLSLEEELLHTARGSCEVRCNKSHWAQKQTMMQGRVG